MLKDMPKDIVFFALKPTIPFVLGKGDMSDKKVYAKHITLAFKPQKEIYDRLESLIGTEVTLTGKYLLEKDGVGRVLVLNPIENYYGKSEPHMTIYTYGQSPNVSNDIINDFNNGDTSITCENIDIEFSGILSGVIYGRKGASYIQNKDWLDWTEV